MSETAVAEPEVKAEPKPEVVEPTKDAVLSVTEPDGDGQTDATKETPAPSGQEPTDHQAELDREAQEAEAALRQQDVERAAQELLKSQQAEARATERKQRIREARTTAVKAVNEIGNNLANLSILNENGDRFKFAPKTVTDIIERLNLDIETVVREEVVEDYISSFNDRLGDDADGFWKAADKLRGEDGNVPVSGLLDLYAEQKALSTSAVKGMTLEQATAASPVLKKAIAEIRKEEYQKGRENPLPAGEPRGDGKITRVPPGPLTLDYALNGPIDEIRAIRARERGQ